MNPRLGISFRGNVAVFLGTLASISVAHVEPRLTPTPTSFVVNASTLSRTEISFIATAGSVARKEISISRAVMDQLSNPQLKSFAQQVIAEHTLVEADLMALAQLKGVDVLSKDESAFSSDWSKRTGDVDRKYVREMVSDYEEAVELFEEAATSGDPDVAAFAQKTVPALQHQLAMVHDLEKAID